MATANHAFVVDKFGVIRVIDFEGGIARVADTCGDRDEPILCSCINDSQLVGIAKRDGSIEIKNPRNPHVNVSFNKTLINLDANDSIAVMYLFNHSRQSCKFLTCTTKGKLTLTTVDFQVDSTPTASDSWSLVEGFKGEISFGDVDDDETTCVFGGDHLILYNLVNHVTSILLPPKPRKNSPPSSSSLTCVSFLGGGRKIAAGTNNNEVHIYIKSHLIPNQRPDNVLRYDAYPIKAITDDPKIMLIHVGNGCGKVATIDTRRGSKKIVHRSYVVKSCDPPGSIRSIARHPKLDIIASCGWDRYLRIWNLNSDELLYEVDLGEHSSIVALFEAENPENDVEQVLEEENDVEQVPEEADDVDNSTSKKEKSKVVSALGTGAKAKNKKQKRKAEPEQVPGEEDDVDNTTNTKEKSKVVSGSAVGSEARVKKRKQKRKQVLEEENDVEQVPEEEDDVDNSTSKKEKSKVVSALGTGARAKKKKQKCKGEPKQVLEEEDDVDNTTNKKEKSKVVSAIGSEGKKKQKKSNSR